VARRQVGSWGPIFRPALRPPSSFFAPPGPAPPLLCMSPEPPSLPAPVSAGEVCAWCMREFERPHGRPVYCQRCFENAFATRKSFGFLPLAEHPLRTPEP